MVPGSICCSDRPIVDATMRLLLSKIEISLRSLIDDAASDIILLIRPSSCSARSALSVCWSARRLRLNCVRLATKAVLSFIRLALAKILFLAICVMASKLS